MDGGTDFFAERVATSSDSRFAAIRVERPFKETAIVLLDTKYLTVQGVVYESIPGLRYQRMLDVSRDGLVAVAENGAPLMRANLPPNIAIVDPARNTRIADFPGTRQGTASLRWSPDGSLLAIGSEPLAPPAEEQSAVWPHAPNSPAVRDAAWIWDSRERRTKISLPLVHSPVRASAISPDNRWMAAQRTKYSRVLGSGVSVWRVSDGAEMFTYETPDARLISDVAFSPSGANFAFVEGQAFKMFRVIS
jgi:WD40 repeat protein